MATSTRVHIAKPGNSVGRLKHQEIERVPEQRWEIKIPDQLLLSPIGKAGITNTHPACLSGCLWLPNEDADRNIHCNV